jgi:hypothetical protein
MSIAARADGQSIAADGRVVIGSDSLSHSAGPRP